MDEIDHLITEFREKLNQDITEKELIDRHLIFGTPYIFRDDEYIYFTLKEKIATYFGVSNTEVYMIGSAKLGFSISPTKLWRKINDDSDIDMVIISEKLLVRSGIRSSAIYATHADPNSPRSLCLFLPLIS